MLKSDPLEPCSLTISALKPWGASSDCAWRTANSAGSYDPELKRAFSAWETFGVAFSIM
jgi:hypothetical protein